jgi:PPOX class probable F420-dependent enzyme
MPVTLPQSLKTLLTEKVFGHVVTLNNDGKPQVSMVWMDVDGDEVLFNTAEGRLKPQNLKRDPRIIVSVQDPKEPMAYAIFHGKARVTDVGADEHIDKLAKRFLGADKYPFRQPGEKRLIVRIPVDRIGGFGPGMQPWS